MAWSGETRGVRYYWPSLLVPFIACQEPTQIEVVLSTDLLCDQISVTTITVGRPGQLEDKHPARSSPMCVPGSKSLGTITLVPSGSTDEEFAIRVVTGTAGVNPDDCVNDGNKGCIVARRSLRYLPNQKLFLPIPMYAECKGVYCEPGTTCYRTGICRPANIDDPERCTTPGACDPNALRPIDSPDPGSAGMSGSGGGEAGGGGMGEAGAGLGGMGDAGLGGASGAGTGGSGAGDAGAGSSGEGGSSTGGAGAGGLGTGGSSTGGAGAGGSGAGGAGAGGKGTGGSGTSGSGTGGSGTGGSSTGGAGGSGTGGSGTGGAGGVGGIVNGIVAADADIETLNPACTIVDLSGYPVECYNPTGGVEPGITIRADLPSVDGTTTITRTFTIFSDSAFLALYDIVPNVVQKTTIEFPSGAPASCLTGTLISTSPLAEQGSLPPGAVRFNSGAPWGGFDFPKEPPPSGPPIAPGPGGELGPNPCKSLAIYAYSLPITRKLAQPKSVPRPLKRNAPTPFDSSPFVLCATRSAAVREKLGGRLSKCSDRHRWRSTSLPSAAV